MRILIVEDSAKMAGLLKKGLEREGYAVDVVGSGQDAVWMATENDYDAIMLGFPEAFVSEAFKPFTRPTGCLGARPGSAGLGLAVVSTIARAHGGRAWAENRPAGGARVTVEMTADVTEREAPRP